MFVLKRLEEDLRHFGDDCDDVVGVHYNLCFDDGGSSATSIGDGDVRRDQGGCL